MTELPPAIDQPTLERVVRTIRDTEWSWDRAGFQELARRLELTPLVDKETGGVYDAPWPSRGRAVQITYHPEHGINDFAITLATAVGLPDTPPEFLVDVFAMGVRTLTGILGEPTRRTPGERPEARWDGERQTVSVKRLKASVTLFWAGNEWQRVADFSNAKAAG